MINFNTDEEFAAYKSFEQRYSRITKPPRHVIKQIRKLDDRLDLKMYLPTGKWHVVRYANGISDIFTRCFALEDDPLKGMHSWPGTWLYDYLIKCDLQKRNILEEVEREEEEFEKNEKNKVKDLAEDMAKSMYKPLIAELDGAVTTKTVWTGATLER